MPLRDSRNFHRKLIFIALAILLALYPVPANAWSGEELPPFEVFVRDVTNGRSDELRGIYVPGVLADEIAYQPSDEPTFISSHPNTLTVFGMASRYGTTGLLAHNTLAGQDFSELDTGQVVYLIYGDGKIESFIIREFLRYQALQPLSVTSNFVDLESGDNLTASNLFLKVFNRPGYLVLQTCIYADGDNSWGRLFILAVPLSSTYFLSMPVEAHIRYY